MQPLDPEFSQDDQIRDHEFAEFEGIVGEAAEPVFDDAENSPIGHPVIAWAVVVIIVAFVMVMQALPRTAAPAADPTDEASTGLNIGDHIMEMQCKSLVGASDFGPIDGQQQLKDNAPAMDVGPLNNRLRFVILAGEIAGPKEALERLKRLNKKIAKQDKFEPTKIQSKLLANLERLYQDYKDEKWDAPSVSKESRQQICDVLGWTGRLAVTPEQSPDNAAREAVLAPARRTMFVMVGAILFAAAAGLTGFVLVIILIVLAARGNLRSRVRTGSRYGGVYAETFAIWLAFFIGSSFLVSWLVRDHSSMMLGPNLVVFGLSLVALAWPLVRGLSWTQLRKDIGLIGGDRPWVEPFWGVIGYLANLPLIALGVIFLMIALKVKVWFGGSTTTDEFSQVGMPSHPLVEWVAESGWTGWIQILALACIAAPIVEETLFRGVLYRHLRECSAKWRIGASVALSALLNSLVFAAIHPQGLLGIPLLMGIATGFSLLREWRGSLIASMTAHAVNNAVVTTLLILMVS